MTEQVDVLLYGASQLATVPSTDADGGTGPQRGAALGTLGIIEDGAVAINDGAIVAVGPTNDLRARFDATVTYNAAGRCVTPGFVDPHTHIPWAGERAAEFEMRVGGATYMEIMAAGGGINATMTHTRAADFDALVEANFARLDAMLTVGTTSIEAKTGYGMNLATELKQLDVIAALDERHVIDLTPTFMPAHAVPPEYKGRSDDYVTHVIEEILPAGAEWMARHNRELFCDVFCESGVFNVAQTRRIFQRALALGYRLKIHADEFEGLGGTALAVELGATSADHLVATPDADIAALGASDTIAVALPSTPFGLGHHDFTPARKILAAGGALALATDYNPGSSPNDSLQLSLAIAGRYLGLTPAQGLAAITRNAAHAIGRGSQVGSLAPGMQADLVVLDRSDYRYLGYHVGSNLVHTVIKRGHIVFGGL